MFDADRPITSAQQDRLNRASFAKNLARSMLDIQNPDSIVIGLYGGWGVGKTSLVNLVIEELNVAANNTLEEDQPLILNFSAWSYSGTHQLIYNFFQRLSSALRSMPHLDNRERIVNLLELYLSFFTNKPAPQPLRSKKGLFGNEKEEAVAAGWESGQNLFYVKAELNELLRKQRHKIIIIIDNISRLYDYEIKQIFQIVKSMADYANTAYLLVFDKGQVIRALNHLEEGGGEQYFEKVVQLPFRVPPILQQDLEKIFADRMQAVMRLVPEDTWNTEYWSSIYYNGLKYFFKNCRDITRYVNILNFSYVRIRDIVNPIDYFALTALEIFTPLVYLGIRDNKDLFTDLFDHVYALDEETMHQDRLRCDEILGRTDRVDRAILLELCMQLFPRIRRIYQPDAIFYHSDNLAYQLRRICSPDLFDAYFRLSMPTGNIPQSEFETILAMASDSTGFDQALNRLNQDNRITTFLDRFNNQVLGRIRRDDIPVIISTLLDNGDLFPVGGNNLLSLNTPMRIHHIIHGLLRRYESTEERFLVLQHAIAAATKSIYSVIYELNEQAQQHTENSSTYLPIEFRDLTTEQLSSLQLLAVSRIKMWADNGSLVSHPKLLAILSAWQAWGGVTDWRAFIKNMTDSDKGLVTFLQLVFAPAIQEAMTEYKKTLTWDQCLLELKNYVDPHTLEAHAKALFEDDYFEKLKEPEQLALMIFLDLMKTPTNKMIPYTG